MENTLRNQMDQPRVSDQPVSEQTILSNLIKFIIRNWIWFLVIGFLAAIAGFFYASQKKPVYQSYASFALEGGQDKQSAAMGIANQLGISLAGGTDVFEGDNILRIIMSRRIIEGTLLTVDTFKNKPITLIEYYQLFIAPKPTKEETKKIHFYPGEQREDFSYEKDSLLYQVYKDFKENRITARRPEKNLNIYEILVKTPDEEFTKVFTDILIDKTTNFYKEISSQKTKETLEILEKRVPAMKNKLDATISSKAAIEDANLNTAFAGADVQKIMELSDSKVYGNAYSELFKNLEMARFQYLKSIPLLQIIDAPKYPMQKIKPGKIITALIFAVVTLFITLLVFMGIYFIRVPKRIV